MYGWQTKRWICIGAGADDICEISSRSLHWEWKYKGRIRISVFCASEFSINLKTKIWKETMFLFLENNYDNMAV